MHYSRFLWLLLAIDLFHVLSSKPTGVPRKGFPRRSRSGDLAEARKYLSLPDLSVVGEAGGILTHKAINTWASSIRTSQEGCDPVTIGTLANTKKQAQDEDAEKQSELPRPSTKGSDNVPMRRVRPNPWRRLMALPLWQTSLLSCKHVLVHSNDEVTYRERTFPTARQSR
jgi:hypothetical protein